MCGIVGLYLKNDKYQSRLGELFAPMMIAMTERGPDSAGFAIYGDAVESGIKFTLRHEDENYDWEALAKAIEEALVTKVDWFQNNKVAVFKVEADADLVENYLRENHPDVLIMSAGSSIEILKEVGLPERIVNMFNLDKMQGSHIIGHTRMATESAVTMAGSHPFSTGMDLCLVHNGSLSNHNRMRQELKRNGIHFDTENDTEVAAGYLTYRLQQGDSLHQALENALKELDGFYTFTIGTKDGFAVVRDPVACKPAVIAETDDYVAMASEYQALTTLPGIENAKVWEPEPSTIYVWERGSN
ncbi:MULTISPECIES: glutamine amidotransferase family protein [unclassified Methylophaga]|jgi:amidophosphoribosyltransferase|uniref:class II glutamine amidotransferase n=1 Tax=unclassified Methylophaga TaxID=2629249 RepID=UPI000C91EDCE|nr:MULTISPECIES: glutamine amidotransferase family protein [unclassified Methylophaga]MAY18372.1 amidophosphoribosyltransferase [Methylophaga sp.]MBN46650.1 amidophosphoribosyltransferase [Methylophaga sp.]HCD04698.1 amidophosphoribosyltransferase [Methylophaga sp.]|tara:strand:- start:40989 stop:41891 length:903 start_codon:yes stop_codon:yes gene_type:complete